MPPGDARMFSFHWAWKILHRHAYGYAWALRSSKQAASNEHPRASVLYFPFHHKLYRTPPTAGTCSQTVFSIGALSILHNNHQDNDTMLILRTSLDTKIHLKSELDQAGGNENICYHDPIYGIFMCCLHCTLLFCFISHYNILWQVVNGTHYSTKWMLLGYFLVTRPSGSGHLRWPYHGIITKVYGIMVAYGLISWPKSTKLAVALCRVCNHTEVKKPELRR